TSHELIPPEAPGAVARGGITLGGSKLHDHCWGSLPNSSQTRSSPASACEPCADFERSTFIAASAPSVPSWPLPARITSLARARLRDALTIIPYEVAAAVPSAAVPGKSGAAISKPSSRVGLARPSASTAGL